ncbi:phage tail protein [Tumebacillus sp. ITR2]|uniref:Phage tail protein n=1 Tax=Tumebacillus amylolyticus TaxID=2801339 RepID=A0ABS1JCY1_9BACL|nr:phage tail protein [Tumebacillus amylolyticus]MBL0388120.1 phage tail protein [Tumebacillus amylolyticus]
MAQEKQQRTVVGAYRFSVELKGITVASFSEVSGLQSEIEYEEYNEGGVNDFTYRFPKRTKYSPIVLKRGLSDSFELWQWYQNTTQGNVQKKDGAVILNDATGQEVCRWSFQDAYPVKWSGAELNASRSEVAIETMEIVFTQLKMSKGSS